MKDPKNLIIHFVGIGGIGMSGIAEVLKSQGYNVKGSDLLHSDNVQKLEELGIPVKIGHNRENVSGVDVVVISSAVKEGNPEVIEARKNKIPIIPRAEMLAELMRGKIGIAVAGTHGKTTTTSLLATVLYESGMDPTAIIGGKVDLFGGNARFGKSEYVVAEADESDSSFLYLPATYGIITNIDTDHLDHFGNIEKIDEAFLKFVGKLPFYGLAVVCLDDAGVKRSIKKWTKPILTYGLQSEADFVARDIQIDFSGTRFNVFKRKQKDNLKNNNSLNISYDSLGEFKINIYGVHNVKNALAVVALSFELGLSIENIQKGLSAFLGAKRRFEVLWKSVEKKNKILIDDYAHHPTEIMATLSTVRELWKGRIFSIFQPHRYSRFVYSRGGFLSAFYESDVVCISDIYEAGETPIEGVTSENFVKSLNETKRENQKIEYTGSLDQTFEFIQKEWKDGDLLICMGAGSITKLAHRISKELCH